MDDDLQHPPEEIPKLLDALERGADVVYGFSPSPQRWHRRWASWLFRIVLRYTMKSEIAGKVSGFRAIRANVCRAFESYGGTNVSIDSLLPWGTDRFSAVPVVLAERRFGNSGYGVKTLLKLAIEVVTGFSVLPLRLASILGFVFVIVGFLLMILIIGRYFYFGSSVAGFPFIASSISVFAGVQLFALGTLGEYVAMIHLACMRTPPFVVSLDTKTISDVESSV